MSLTGDLSGLLMATATAPVWVQGGAILGSTFILEDAATVLSGMLAAQGLVSPVLALGALLAGVALGDLGLYGLGRLARRNRWARSLLGRDLAHRARRWLDRELVGTVWATRFLPGTRFAAYTALGFLALPFVRFARAVVLAVAAWTSALFFAADFFGREAAGVLGPWQWPVGIGAALLIILSAKLLRRTAHDKAGS